MVKENHILSSVYIPFILRLIAGYICYENEESLFDDSFQIEINNISLQSFSSRAPPRKESGLIRLCLVSSLKKSETTADRLDD